MDQGSVTSGSFDGSNAWKLTEPRSFADSWMAFCLPVTLSSTFRATWVTNQSLFSAEYVNVYSSDQCSRPPPPLTMVKLPGATLL